MQEWKKHILLLNDSNKKYIIKNDKNILTGLYMYVTMPTSFVLILLNVTVSVSEFSLEVQFKRKNFSRII